MNWRVIYVLAFVAYLGMNAVVVSTMKMSMRDAVVFPFAAAISPALLGMFVVRYFRERRTTLNHILLGLAFSVTAVAITLLLLWIGLNIPNFRPRLDSSLWAFMTNTLIFIILTSISHLRRMQSDLAAAEASRAKAELAALRARIDPHFLFNTLHSLLALVRQDPFRAEEAIEQFGDILRYTFAAGDGSEERTLQQEWQLVDNYLALERLRLGARLHVDSWLDPAVAGVPLPVLTLQPIVENAIRHAIAPRAGGGRIEIRATRIDHHVRIEVCDDGPGVPATVLASTRGQGLQLVRERLDRMYRGEAKIDLGTAPAGGLAVSIVLPLED